MANLKATIDYNTILFKAQLNYIAIVSVSETIDNIRIPWIGNAHKIF